jgi:hypothetical protein
MQLPRQRITVMPQRQNYRTPERQNTPQKKPGTTAGRSEGDGSKQVMSHGVGVPASRSSTSSLTQMRITCNKPPP